MDVVLRKIGRSPGRAVSGKMARLPKVGAVLVIEFPDGMHEYVTTPIKRVLQVLAPATDTQEDGVRTTVGSFYVQTANSCYRLDVLTADDAARLESSSHSG